MSHLRRLSFSLIVLAAAACTTRQGPPPGARPAPAPEPAPVVVEEVPEEPTVVATTMACPPELADAEVRVEDHDRGATLVFTSTGAPEELRSRAIAFAAAHNRDHGMVAMQAEGDTGSPEPRDESKVGTGTQVGNETSRGPDTEGGTEGSTGIETPNEEVQDPTAIDQSTVDEQGKVYAGGTAPRSLTMSILTASAARVEYVDNGAQIIFEGEDVDALRAELRELERACNVD